MERKQNEKMLGFFLAMCLLSIAIPVLTETASGQVVPYPLRGFVMYENGTPVVSATVTVTRILSGTHVVTTTGSDGFYLADSGGLSISNGDSLRVDAVKGALSEQITHTVNLALDPANVNLTLGQVLENLFSVHFYVLDANGVGVENVTLIIHPDIGANFTLFTDIYGQVIPRLPPGNYSFLAITFRDNLYNQSGTFRLSDRNINVTVDLSKKIEVSEHKPSILGIRISGVCLISLTFCFAIMLGGLFILFHWRWSR